ncbi:MAG: NTP transferase domain-containing protein [Deltaproteobacteria bacterium]|nr:NTP transferase domain-containing protein [Deltaproteobacteria bacterium]
MKAIVLAGGTGSRLMPLTKVTNKHLLPVGREPMILHPIRKLVRVGIRDILVVTGTEHMGDVVGLLGSGGDFGCEFTYRVQDRPGGIAQALGLGGEFARGQRLIVVLGDNIFEDELGPYVERFARQERGARLLLKEVDDPERFGVAEVRDGRIVSIEEKPARPKSRYAVTGIYFYDEQVFDFIATLRPSQRGELEISDVNSAYIGRGEAAFDVLDGWWTDAGTFESLARANELMMSGGQR